jgi:hypothetical protein
VPVRRVCAFLSSSPGLPAHAEAARALARELARDGRTLVYGGASVGLMGVLAEAAIAAGVRVVGVLPEALVRREVAHGALTELHVVPSMHARKARMFAEADGFVGLPGGFGTLEELFEVLTAQQLGLHRKPTCLVDVDGFWAPLLGFLDHAVAQRVLQPSVRALLGVAATPAAALCWLDERG